MEQENEYKEALMKMNMEYKELLNSREFLLGTEILKAKYFIKKGRIFYALGKFFTKKKRKYLHQIENQNNENIFKNNDDNVIGEYDAKDNIAIYTCNIGGYDKPQEPLIVHKNCDYFFISDVKPEGLVNWKWLDAKEFLPDINLSTVKKARYLKTHPHLIFPNYKYSIFIDGNIKCVLDISDFIKRINKKTRIAIHPHPYRDCIYKEGYACEISKRGDIDRIKKQLKEYEAEGMPKGFGLFETNVFVREHNNELCKKIMEEWWNEIKDKSQRDQISFTYVLWKNGLVANDIGKIQNTILENNYVQVVPHLEEYQK